MQVDFFIFNNNKDLSERGSFGSKPYLINNHHAMVSLRKPTLHAIKSYNDVLAAQRHSNWSGHTYPCTLWSSVGWFVCCWETPRALLNEMRSALVRSLFLAKNVEFTWLLGWTYNHVNLSRYWSLGGRWSIAWDLIISYRASYTYIYHLRRILPSRRWSMRCNLTATATVDRNLGYETRCNDNLTRQSA